MNLEILLKILTLAAAIIASLAGIFAALTSLMNRDKLKTLHVQINSRLDALLVSTAEQQRAKGNLEGRAQAKSEADAVLAAKMGTTDQAKEIR